MSWLVRKASTAFEAAALENFLASFSGHALKKAMLFGALTFFGLVCAFRHTFVFLHYVFYQV
jgi:hypothetical protein